VADYDPLDPATDPFRPPAVSTIVQCLHCGEEYDSYRIEWRVETDPDGQQHGFWCCPIENCDGRGFGFDILPIDPEYRDERAGWMWSDDDEDEEEFDESDDENSGGEMSDVEESNDHDQANHGPQTWDDDDIPF
jgi:hypothetical protein